MAASSVYRSLRGLFAGISVVVSLSMTLGQCKAEARQKIAANLTEAKRLLQHGRDLADLYDWSDTVNDFRTAEKEFGSAGDERDAFYAQLSLIHATIQQRNLPSWKKPL